MERRTIVRGQKNRWDVMRKGALIGAFLPIVVITATFLFFYFKLDSSQFSYFIRSTSNLSRIVSLSVLPNALLFFIAIRKDMLYLARGFLAATIVWAMIVFILAIVF